MSQVIRIIQSYGESWGKLVIVVLESQDSDIDRGLGDITILKDGDEFENGSVVGCCSLRYSTKGKR
jgi:hypothetical protein